MHTTHQQLKAIIKEEIKKALSTEADRISFYEMLKLAKPGDKLSLNFQRNGYDWMAGVEGTPFKAGKTYKASVGKDGKILIFHEEVGPFFKKWNKSKKTKEDMIKTIRKNVAKLTKDSSPAEKGKKYGPCNILSCKKSTVTREGLKSKTISAILANPEVLRRAAAKTPKKEVPPVVGKAGPIKPVNPTAAPVKTVDPSKTTLKDIEFLKDFDNAKCAADEKDCTDAKKRVAYKKNLTTYHRMKAEIVAREKAAAKAKAKTVAAQPAQPTAVAKPKPVAQVAPAQPAKAGQKIISTPYTMSTRWQVARGAEKEEIRKELIAKGWATPENWRRRKAEGIPMTFPEKPKPPKAMAPVTAIIPPGDHNKVFRELGRVSRHTWKPAVKKLVDKNKMNFEQAVEFVYSHYLTAKAKADAEGRFGYYIDPKPFWAVLRKLGIMDVQYESNQKRTGNLTIKVVLKEAQADSAKKKKSKKA
jgi:hypothetical protein